MLRLRYVGQRNRLAVPTLTKFLRSKPATGAEYKIMMCRSTSATGGFVDKSGVSCTANGGTVLLASHGTTYGPGGQ